MTGRARTAIYRSPHEVSRQGTNPESLRRRRASGRAQVNDDIFDLGPGDFASIPAGVAHTFDNIRKEPAKAINLMTFGGFDDFLATEARLRHDTAAMARLEEKHGVTILGPPLRVKLGLRST